MKWYGMLVLVGLVVGMARGEEPVTRPATQGAETTRPTTRSTKKYPTPDEIYRELMEKRAAEEAKPHFAYFDLSKPIIEKPADFSLFGDPDTLTLRTVVARLHQAREDDDIEGVLITIGETGISLAQAEELRDAIRSVRKAGKETFVYADAYDTVSYTVASGARHICMLGGGQILIPGVGLEATFAKGLLDKVGVQADYVQIGEYKGADEQFTRTEPSDALRGELNKVADGVYRQIVDGISRHRGLKRDEVKALIDEAMISGNMAVERALVDHLVDIDGLRALIAEQIGEEEIVLVHHYGEEEREEIDWSNPFALFSSLMKRPEVSDRPAVALVYAEGMIIDGEGGEGLFEDAVGSEDLRKAFRRVLRNDQIKAVVLRIDSPGGSALASEAMWQAARRVAKEKPLIISIGGMAASGGYYLASAGDYVFADSTAVVGSIGVVGGKFVMKDLFDKLGLTTESFTRGANADLFSSVEPFDENQRKMLNRWMTETYDTFKERILVTRGKKIRDIDSVARGRIFIASQAKELGMVDEIGGIESAIIHAAQSAGMEDGEYDVRVVPAPMTLGDLLRGTDPDDPQAKLDVKVTVKGDSVLRLLPASVRKVLMRQVQMAEMMGRSPVMLVSPVVVRVR